MIEMQRHWLTRQLFVCLAGMALSLLANDVSEKNVLFAAGRWLETNMAFWGNDELAEPVAAKRLTNADGNPLPCGLSA